MAEIPRKVDIDLVISEKTAEGMCRLLTDFLNEHVEKTIEVATLEGEYLNGTRFVHRTVSLVERG